MRQLVGGNDDLGVGVAAHAVDGTGGASADGIGIAARMFGGDGDRAIRAAYDGAFVIERIGAAEVDDEAGILGTAHKRNAGADFDAEGFVGLSIGNAGSRGGTGRPAALDVDGAGRGSGTARVLRCANACWIGSRADIVLEFLLRVFPGRETSRQKNWQYEQATENC